jgi:peptide/nickel transport system substrate-binding protein
VTPGQVLREAFDYRFSQLDPTGAHIDPPSVALYEPLVVKGSDWRPHGLLASRWTTSADGLEWRFGLRPGLRFHSGDPCDADAVIRAFEFLRYGAFDQPDQLWYWDPVDTVTADGPTTLVFRLNHPYARLPSLLWGTHTAVYNEARRTADPETFGHALADGTGPYRLVSWSEERVVAERWPGYQAPPAPFLRGNDRPPDSIEWSAILDPAERLDALESGRVHVIHAPPLNEVDRLVSEGRLRVVEFAQQSNVYLTVDFRRTDLRFDDVRLRLALSFAIDREALVRDVLHGHGASSLGAIPPGDEHYDPAPDGRCRFDPQEAGRILDDLGFTVSPDGVREIGGTALAVRCVCQDDAVLLPLAEAVRDQLRRVGVVLELEPVVPFEPFYSAAAAGPPATISKWLWPDPLDALIGFTATRAAGAENWQHASLPALDAAFDEWLKAPQDDLARAASRVQEVVARDLPYIPLVTPNDVWVSAPELDGYLPYQANLYPFYQPVRLASR